MFMHDLRNHKWWLKHSCAIVSLTAFAVFTWKTSLSAPQWQVANERDDRIGQQVSIASFSLHEPVELEVVAVSASVDKTDGPEVAAPTWKQLEQFESVEVIATGYFAGYESTGKHPGDPQYGITYSGIEVKRDHLSTIAADPNVFPLGTILWIPGYGYGIVADTGSAIKGNKIDLYFETKEDVYRLWGKKKVRVYVIEKGEGKVTEALYNEKLKRFSS